MTKMGKTKRGAASVYIVIFTTTLLGIITLSFVRIMLSEASRTTNYNLSQSAYNSSLAGIEDAKIVLLRHQNCVNDPGYLSNCADYLKAFDTETASAKTAQDCDIVRTLLGYKAGENETLIQTNSSAANTTSSAQAYDQAYTCVKITAHTDDYITNLNDNNPTKIIPLRAATQGLENNINNIALEWFSLDDWNKVTTNDNLNSEWYGISHLNGALTYNNNEYKNDNSIYQNNFVATGSSSAWSGIAPPPIQVTAIQSNSTFKTSDFYTSDLANNRTNRGTLLLRPSKNAAATTINSKALAYSANKSFNTPIDVKCDTKDFNGGYACSANIYLPKPMNGNDRNMSTAFLVVNLPYSVPSTELRVRMQHCETKDGVKVCENIKFANVQPMVDSTGRANDLFRRVGARIELVDTYFPIANYALAMTDPNNTKGIEKNFYVTQGCEYSSSYWKKDTSVPVAGGYVERKTSTCNNSGGANGE